MLFDRQDEDIPLGYQHKKIMHVIQLQIMDIESTLHYIQKKHSTHQLKQALSQIYNIFNEMESVFKQIKGMFLNRAVKKLMNCFGIIYLIQADFIDHGKKYQKELTGSSLQNFSRHSLRESEEKSSKEQIRTQNCSFIQEEKNNIKPFGGVYLYNQNYQRCMNGTNERKPRKTLDKKATLTKDQFNRQVLDEINEKVMSMPNPDEMLDLFAFKFKYGKESQMVTFHDELQSIAKFFRDAQNDAFQFLNKCKGQGAQFQYNETFKDIMSLVKVEKESKLKQFNKKITTAFNNLKNKTESHMNQIQAKLEEAEQIKNRYVPPETTDKSTQTSNTYEEELKYLKRKYEDSEEKYNLMCEIKKKEIEGTAMNQIALQNQLGLKMREIVFLKLSVEENTLIIANLNKRVKFLVDSHREIRQNVVAQFRQKRLEKEKGNSSEEKDEEFECLKGVTKKIVESETVDQKLELLKKQKKMAKRMVMDSRRSSLLQKSQFQKRLTQQPIIPHAGSNSILDKWNLSQVTEHDEDKNDARSTMSNKNNILTQHKIKTNQIIKLNIREERESSKARQMGTQSIKLIDNALKKKSTTRNISHFIEIDKKQLKNSKAPESIYEDSLIGDSEESERESDATLLQAQEMERIEKMYERQVNKAKNRILPGSGITRSNHFGGGSHFIGTPSPTHQYTSSSFRQESLFKNTSRDSHFSKGSVVNSPMKGVLSGIAMELKKEQKQIEEDIKENQQTENVQKYESKIEALENQVDSLLYKYQRNDKWLNFSIVHKEVALMIEPEEKSMRNTQHKKGKLRKQRYEGEKDTDSSEFRTVKYGEMSLEKERKDGKQLKRKENRQVTQAMPRQQLQSRGNMFSGVKVGKFPSEHVKRSEKKNPTNFIFKADKAEKMPQEERMKTDLLGARDDKIQRIKTDLLGVRDDSMERLKTSEAAVIEDNFFSRYNKENNKLSFWGEKKHEKKASRKINDVVSKEEEKQVREIAMKCKNIKEFKEKIVALHKQKCGQNCSHLQQYLANFAKYREQSKMKLKMHIQNVHNSIECENINDNSMEFPKLKRVK